MSEPVASDPIDPIAAALDNPAPAPLLAEPGEAGPQLGGTRRERPPLPPACPVRCLGIAADISGAQKCFYLDVNGQLVGLEAGTRHGKNSLIALFGDASDWLELNFPQWSKPVTEYDRSTKTHTVIRPSEIVGFDQAEASRALIEECARKGPFDPSGRMRGRGAHALPGGGLVMHFGDQLLAIGARVDGSFRDKWDWREPGLFERMVYPSATAIPKPWHQSGTPRPAITLRKLFETWHWRRAQLDPLFLLGGVGASMLGGALPWRPNLWITGGAGTGKSTLNGEGGVLDLVLGEGVLRTGNASAAAIRQILKNSTVPVMFDEIEASEDNRRVSEVVDLARVSSSGATMHRGGQDHQAHEFTLRSCFWFSSINIPPIAPQDRSRLGILELKPFARGAIPPVLADFNLPDIGRQLQRRMIDGWPRLAATNAAFQAALSAAGHTRRACDQFGTLLACAHLALDDELPDAEAVYDWVKLCSPQAMAEVSEATTDHEACLEHITTSLVQSRGGEEREAIATWIGKVVSRAIDPMFDSVTGDVLDEAADKRLQQLGLKVVNANWLAPELDAAGVMVTREGRWGARAFESTLPGYLAVAVSHRGLQDLFKGSKWQGGVWRQSLARFPGALDPVKVKFGHLSARAVLVPLADVLDASELPNASKPEAVAAWLVETKGAEV